MTVTSLLATFAVLFVAPPTQRPLEAWLEDVRSGDPPRQLAACRALAAKGPAARPALPDVLDLLFRQAALEPAVRQEARRAARAIGLAPVDELVRTLQD